MVHINVVASRPPLFRQMAVRVFTQECNLETPFFVCLCICTTFDSHFIHSATAIGEFRFCYLRRCWQPFWTSEAETIETKSVLVKTRNRLWKKIKMTKNTLRDVWNSVISRIRYYHCSHGQSGDPILGLDKSNMLTTSYTKSFCNSHIDCRGW